jgi:hypothetical protein
VIRDRGSRAESRSHIRKERSINIQGFLIKILYLMRSLVFGFVQVKLAGIKMRGKISGRGEKFIPDL